MKRQPLALLILLALFASACGASAKREAYDNAVKMEQQVNGDHDATIAEYQKVIHMEPGSTLAKKAQTRIDAIQAKVHAAQKSDELNKSVFHADGID